MSDSRTLPPPQPVDELGRPTITAQMKARINAEFATIEPGKRGAFIMLVDESGVARGHFAARIGKTGNWKVAAGGGFALREKKPIGFIGILGAW